MNKLSCLFLGLTSTLAACTDADTTDGGDQIAEGATKFRVTIQNVAPWTVLKSGTQAQKVDGTTGAAGPGGAFEIAFTGGRHQAISFATMFGQSNDWFFAPGPQGLSLFNEDGQPISGDITNQIHLYDAGTEIDQEPGVGDATGPRQPSPDFGAPDPIAMVRELGRTVPLTDGGEFSLPDVASMIRVTLTPACLNRFVLRIENVSNAATLHTSAGTSGIGISPVAWALHVQDAPLFTPGTADRAQGLEWIAESGRVAMLGSSLAALSGAATPLSPGLFVVHQDPEPLYALGLADLGMGLEPLAEDGDARTLSTMVSEQAMALSVDSWGNYDVPEGRTQKAPAMPGESFVLDVVAMPGDRFSFASMFGMSNDWFFATRPAGIALFDEAGEPRRGDVSADLAIYDAGSEVDQEIAIGPDTGPQQNGPDTGAADPLAQVREVSPATYAAPASSHVRVTIEPVDAM